MTDGLEPVFSGRAKIQKMFRGNIHDTERFEEVNPDDIFGQVTKGEM